MDPAWRHHMAKWRVTAKVVGSKYLGEFEAKSKREAEALAFESEKAGISLCHQCADECEDPEVESVHAERVAKKPAPAEPSSP